MRRTSVLVILAAGLVAPATSQPATTIEGVSWRLMEISSLDAATLDQSPRAIARFADGRLRGFSGCNRFTGSYTLAGDRVTVGRQTHTVNKCADPAIDVETRLKQAFATPVRYSIVDGRLQCTSESGTKMVFEAEPAHALEGVEWEVTEFDNAGGALVKPSGGTTMSLSFRGDGAVVGNSGCNLFKAAYTRDGERLVIDRAVATHKACTGVNVMEQERAFLAALTAVQSWTLRGELLDLFLADGQRAVTAERPAQ
ncbi:MAG TPA: META domain-containing protein [Thermoanaerobaculia bacterium]|jgi:heat shock protein HslJ|nr:META domain-containing protein [Thermoanaerobaculia bacterium]